MEAVQHNRTFAAGKAGDGTESLEAGTSQDDSPKPTITEEEFGSGTLDSAYQPQAWRDMGKMFQQEILSDVMLMAEGQSIPCHKILLASASEYFYTKLVAASDASAHNLLEIEGISFKTLKAIVSYIYTGHVNITVENAGNVIPACKILKLSSAYATCESYLMDKITPANSIGLYNVATINGIPQLQKKAKEVMVNNFKEVVSGPEFQSMSVHDVEEYIQNEGLRIPNEDPVYDAVISWISYQPEERSLHFSQLIKNIRFRFCSTFCVRYVALKEPLMDTAEYQKVLLSALKHQTDGGLCLDKVRSECKDCSILPRQGYQCKPSMHIIGGVSDPGDHTSRECWRLENGKWEAGWDYSMPMALQFFGACLIIDSVVVTGGYNNGKPVSKSWILSTSAYQWSALPDMNTARQRHISVCVGGQVYVIAGEGADGIEMSSVECLQRNSGQWEVIPDIPKPLVHPVAVGYGQCIYVFGGTDMKSKHSDSCYVYGTNSKSWHELPDMPHTCKYGSAVLWKDMIYLVGGFGRLCMSFNPATNTWSTLSQCRYEHADGPAFVWIDRILVCGGRSNNAKCEKGNAGGTSQIEEYDTETDTWSVSHIKLPLKLWAQFMFSTEAAT